MTFLLVGVGGFLGAISRYSVDLLVSNAVGTRFPLGILIVNVSGAFVLGVLFAVTDRGALPDAIRLPAFVGFIGAYTTFSTLMLDSWRLGQDGALLAAVANLAGSVVLGMLAVGAGLAVGRIVGSN
ncbi:MAG: CrcB family protein [Chloroflexi bacterium]|nr:CrcB family protein [Chloroflexota bacterium]